MEAGSSGSTKTEDAEQSVSGTETRADSYGLEHATGPGSSDSNQESVEESAGSNQATELDSIGSNQATATEICGSNRVTGEESSGSNQAPGADDSGSNQAPGADDSGSNQATGADDSGSNQATGADDSGSNQAPDAESSDSNQDKFILKHVKFRNFVNFEEEQELTFDKNGVYFLVGQNSSGKSSVLEAIRRCMSLRYNSSFSKVSNKFEDSIVVCKFKRGEQTFFSFSICKAQSKSNSHEARPEPQEAKLEHQEAKPEPQEPKSGHQEAKPEHQEAKPEHQEAKPEPQEAKPEHQEAKPEPQEAKPAPCLKGCVLLDEHEHISEFGMDEVEISKTGELVSEQLSSKSNHAFPKMGTEVDLKKFAEWVYQIEKDAMVERHGEQKRKRGKEVNSACERLLKRYIDNIVFIFPMRSFGPLQWSKSDKIEKKPEIYIEASQRAEVIMWYLKRLREKEINGSSGDEEKINVERFYDFITNQRGGEYYLKDSGLGQTQLPSVIIDLYQPFNVRMNKWYGMFVRVCLCMVVFVCICIGVRAFFPEYWVLSVIVSTSCLILSMIYLSTNNQSAEIMVKIKGQEFSILKQSEGFVEAMLCSILLAVDEFATVLLEDAGIGMHPQMIDRLCIVLSEKMKNKVVVISTHNPGFLKPWLLENIFYFKRTDRGKFKVTSGKLLSKIQDLKSAIPGSISNEQFANFCYAETIVFVEGDSDLHFIEAFARVMRRQEDDRDVLFCGFQFAKMGSFTKWSHFKKCCKILNKRYAFVLDANEDEKKDIKKRVVNPDERENLFFMWGFEDIESVFYTGVLEELKAVTLREEIKTIIEKCFGKRVHISKDGKNEGLYRIKQIDPEKNKKYKVFLHGSETFEERLILIEYLLTFDSELNGFKELHRLRTFLTNLHQSA